jgi:hypothetical protein
VAPSTCVSIITKHKTSVPGGYDYYMCRRHHHSLRTFHYGGFWWSRHCALRNGLSLRKCRGLLNSWRRFFFTSCYIGFLAFPGQNSIFPAKYKFGDQPSKDYQPTSTIQR